MILSGKTAEFVDLRVNFQKWLKFFEQTKLYYPDIDCEIWESPDELFLTERVIDQQWGSKGKMCVFSSTWIDRDHGPQWKLEPEHQTLSECKCKR